MKMTQNTVSGNLENTKELTAEVLDEYVEKRRYTRRAAVWRASITTRSKQVVECKLKDVSERGASIASPVDFKKNALVMLQISAYYNGKTKPLKVLGEIKHTSIAPNGFTLGVYIKDAADSTFAFLKKYAEGQI